MSKLLDGHRSRCAPGGFTTEGPIRGKLNPLDAYRLRRPLWALMEYGAATLHGPRETSAPCAPSQP